MKRFNTLLDAASYLIRNGYVYDADYNRFRRASWNAYLTIQKNGRCNVTVL